MASVALVVFNRNDRSGVLSLLSKVGDAIPEVLLIDSSEPPESALLKASIEGHDYLTYRHVFPLGCTEPLREYAADLVKADRIVAIDTDETPTDGLLHRLSEPIDADVLWVPRRDAGIGSVRWLPRVYRPDSLRYEGWIHEEPRVLGTSARAAPDEGLEHLADYGHYLSERGRGDAYLPIESFERPFTGRQAWSEFHSWACRLSTLGSDVIPPPVAVAWLLRGLGRNASFEASSYFVEYVRARYHHFVGLSRALRRSAVEVSRELHRHGGVTAYLEFNDPEYVDRLSSGYPWASPPSHPLVELLLHRFRTGSVLKAWDRLGPATEAVQG
jgi:hypothetical protein